MSAVTGKRVWIYCSASDCGGIDVDDKQRPGSQSLSNVDDMVYRADAVITEKTCINVLKLSGYFVKNQVYHLNILYSAHTSYLVFCKDLGTDSDFYRIHS